MLTDDELSMLRLILFRRGLRPGASVEDLGKACTEPMDKVLEGLNQKIAELGLEVVVIEESDEFLSEGRTRAFVRSKAPLHREELKLCGWDRRSLAALAVVGSYLVSRGGRAKEIEVVHVLKSKNVSARRIDRMVEAGYLARDDGMIGLSWRSLAEIDQEQLKRLFLAAKPPKSSKEGA